MALNPGSRLGRYEIVGVLGRGGMGVVFRARDSQLQRELALKVLPPGLAGDPDRRARFQREAELLAALNHPNIAAIYGFEEGESEGERTLVLELVEGPTLASIIAEGPIPLKEVLSIARQIADALECAHEHGIIHRDLKPANIKVRPDGVVKVLDLGLAKVWTGDGTAADVSSLPTMTAHGTRAGEVLGTPAYMSPEQARGRPLDKRTDIWAFGCVLYELLTGRMPFAGETISDTVAAVLEREPDWSRVSESTPAGIRGLLRRCLEKDPRRRLHDIADARIEIEDALAAPTTAGARPLPARSGSPRALWLLAVAGLAALAAIAAGLLVFGRTPRPPAEYQYATFRRGTVTAARFAPDTQTIVYSASWEGAPVRLFSTRVGNPESSSLPLPAADLLSVSSSGTLAIRLDNGRRTLALVPLTGQAPREVADDVLDADWAPQKDALVISHMVDGRSRLEYPIGTVLYDPGPGRGVGYPRFSPNGDRIGFVEFGVGFHNELYELWIAVVDLRGQRRVLAGGWSDVFGLAWAPGGDEIWFTAREAGVSSGGLILHAVTLNGGHRVAARLPGLPLVQQISRDGRVLLRYDNWPQTLVCRTAGTPEERDLSWLDFSWARDVSADGRHVLFDENGFAGGSRGGVYLRTTDGSPAVRLGDGLAGALSPDGRWALAFDAASAGRLTMLPTGAGQPRALRYEGFTYRSAVWFPDGTRILIGGEERGRGPVVSVQDVAGGAPRRLVEGVDRGIVSPDGGTVATVDLAGAVTLTPIDGRSSRLIQGLPAGASLLRWTEMNDEIFARVGGVPAQIVRFNLDTGRMAPWRTLAPSDRSGIAQINGLSLTADGESYCYSYIRFLSTVIVAAGLL